MNQEYEKEFRELLAIWADLTPRSDLTPRKMRGYLFYALTSELSFEDLKEAGYRAIQTHGFFPKINDLFGGQDEAIELQAQQDYKLIEHLADAFIYPGVAEAGMAAVIHQLEIKNKHHLIEMARRFCPEIVQGSNPSATRAQCLKMIKAEIKINNDVKQISEKQRKKIKEVTNMILKK